MTTILPLAATSNAASTGPSSNSTGSSAATTASQTQPHVRGKHKPERLRAPGPEHRIGRNLNSHQPFGTIIEFPAVAAPVRVNPVSIGDLPLSQRIHSRSG